MKINFQPESTLQDIAHAMARTITDRNGETRKTTWTEYNNLWKIAYGALLTINYVGRADDAYSMIQGAKDAAEFIFDVTYPNCNGYDSIYCKLDKYIREHQET